MAIQQSILRPERYGQSLSTSQYAQRSIHPIRFTHYRISPAMLPAIRSAASWRESRARWA